VFNAVEHPTDATYHELHHSHTSSVGVDVITQASPADRLNPLDTVALTHRSMLATSTDVNAQPGYGAPGSGPLLSGYAGSCISGGDQRARGCGVPGTVGPQTVETW